jgi:hypothetical protein
MFEWVSSETAMAEFRFLHGWLRVVDATHGHRIRLRGVGTGLSMRSIAGFNGFYGTGEPTRDAPDVASALELPRRASSSVCSHDWEAEPLSVWDTCPRWDGPDDFEASIGR